MVTKKRVGINRERHARRRLLQNRDGLQVDALDDKVAIVTGGQRRWATNGARAISRIEEHESRAMTTETLYTDTALHAWKLKKHEAISDEDFAKNPLRNRLSVLQTRTTHAGFHAAQIRLTLTKG